MHVTLLFTCCKMVFCLEHQVTIKILQENNLYDIKRFFEEFTTEHSVFVEEYWDERESVEQHRNVQVD